MTVRSPGRVRLYAKPSRSDQVFFLSFYLVSQSCLVAGVVFPSLGVRAVAVLALFLPYCLLVAIRRGAWLKGTALVIRGPLATRRFDLAACATWLTEDPAKRLPVLGVQDAAGRRLDLLLRERGAGNSKVLIAPQKLDALAWAVLAAGPRYPASQQVASQLHWLAGNWPGAGGYGIGRWADSSS